MGWATLAGVVWHGARLINGAEGGGGLRWSVTKAARLFLFKEIASILLAGRQHTKQLELDRVEGRSFGTFTQKKQQEEAKRKRKREEM